MRGRRSALRPSLTRAEDATRPRVFEEKMLEFKAPYELFFILYYFLNRQSCSLSYIKAMSSEDL